MARTGSPRVVMLVDNTVDGDSRVQKSARDLAELGWDVTLVGRSPSGRVQEEQLGQATLLRVPTTLPLNTRGRLAPGRTLRFPLAFPDHESDATATALAAWRHLDLQTRVATGGNLGTVGARALGKARRVTYRLRHRQFVAARKAAGDPNPRSGAALHRPRNQWAFDDPMLADLEVAFAPVLARLAPDLVHAHDFRTIGLAVRYRQRMQAKKGATVPVVVYDAHEFLPGVGIEDARRRRGDEAYERLHLSGVGGTICVAPRTGEELVKLHGLDPAPLVVLNAPFAVSGRWTPDAPDVRSAAGLPVGVPLVVYVGVSAKKRGIDTVAAALPDLPGVHLVLVTKRNAFVASLEKAATEAGCRDRLHVLPYVDPDAVSAYVRTADVGVSVMVGDHLNHQYSLPTKIFEYAQGRIPVITSDVLASREIVEQEGIGVSFPAGDVAAFARAVRTVLADRDTFTAPYTQTDVLTRWTWEAQCHPVDGLYRQLLGRGPDPGESLRRTVQATLDAGDVPPTADVLSAASSLLASADGERDVKDIAARTTAAAALLWHRTLHFDQVGSPFTADPDGFLQPWHAARTTERLNARHSGPVPERPTRDLAILSYKNMTFVPPLERALAASGRTSHRVDLAEVAPGGMPLSVLQQVRTRLGRPAASAWTSALDDALGDSDAVWVEWGQRAAVAASLLPDRSRRVIVRLHSFEAFTVFPHLIDWSAVDDLVFVGPHLRDLLVPRLAGFDAATTRTHVVPNSVDAARWHRPKQPGAERTLAVVGWSAPAKDVVWALDLLAELRSADPTWRLLLVGHEPSATGPAGVQRYRAEVFERIGRPDLAGAVEVVPFTADVPALLERVGFVVSSSVREAHPMAVVEGAASGAVPIVRDWPMLAAFDGPRRLFPADWVVSTVEQAAARVRSTSARFAQDSAAAAAEAAARFDDRVVTELLGRVLDRT